MRRLSIVSAACLAALAPSATGLAQPIQISPTDPNRGNVGALIPVTNDRIVYRRSGSAGNTTRYFSADISAPGIERVLSLESTVLTGGATVAANGRIVYSGNFGISGNQLFSADSALANSQQALSSSGLNSVSRGSVSPDGTRVIFGQGSTANLTAQIASVPVGGGTVTRLSSDPSTGVILGLDNGILRIKLSPNGSQVMYLLRSSNDPFALFVASTTQSDTQFQVSTTSIGGAVEPIFEWMPVGNSAVYAGDLTQAGVVELFRSQTQNPKIQIKLSNSPLQAGGNVLGIVPLATDSRVLYYGDLETDGSIDLYSASTAAPTTQIRLNSRATTGNVVLGGARERIGGGRVVFVGNLSNLNRRDVYAAPTDVANSAILLTSPGATGTGATNLSQDFHLMSDGETVIFKYQRDLNGPFQLFKASASLANSAEPIGFGNEADDSLSVFTISADETQIIFNTQNATSNKTKVWVVAVDGSSPPEQISTTTDWANTGSAVAFMPNGRPIYTLDQLVEGDVQLFTIAQPTPVVPGPTPNVNPPTPNPDPEPTAKRPTVRVQGKKKIVTRKPRVVIRGQAVSELGVNRVEFKVGKGKFKRARGTSKWRAVIKLGKKTKRAKVTIRSIDASGNPSKPTTIRVIRRR